MKVEPGAFRDIHNRLQSEMHGKGRVEVLAMSVVAEGSQSDEFSNPKAAASHGTSAYPVPGGIGGVRDDPLASASNATWLPAASHGTSATSVDDDRSDRTGTTSTSTRGGAGSDPQRLVRGAGATGAGSGSGVGSLIKPTPAGGECSTACGGHDDDR